MKFFIIPLFMVYLLSGCGGGASDNIANYNNSDSNTTLPSQNDHTDSSQIDMKLNYAYTVYPGNRIEKTSDDAEVTIVHIDGHKESIVTLIAGSAILISK